MPCGAVLITWYALLIYRLMIRIFRQGCFVTLFSVAG